LDDETGTAPANSPVTSGYLRGVIDACIQRADIDEVGRKIS
jgi:hypothetical protein